MSSTYKIIHTPDEKEWAQLLIDGIVIYHHSMPAYHPKLISYTLSYPLPNGGRGPAARGVTARWPSTVWRMVIGIHHQHPMARIPTSVGDFIFMRNGNNASAYNYAVLRVSDRKFFYRQTYGVALELIEVLGCPTKDLPTLLNQVHYESNMKLFEQRLKESA